MNIVYFIKGLFLSSSVHIFRKYNDNLKTCFLRLSRHGMLMKIALLCLLKYFFQFRSLPLSQHKTTRKTETKIKGKNLSHIKSSYNLEKK
jgi:hypothetical protein